MFGNQASIHNQAQTRVCEGMTPIDGCKGGGGGGGGGGISKGGKTPAAKGGGLQLIPRLSYITVAQIEFFLELPDTLPGIPASWRARVYSHHHIQARRRRLNSTPVLSLSPPVTN